MRIAGGCITWWRHQMETFSALLGICAGNSPASGEFPAQRPVTRSFDVFFDLRRIEQLNKQPWGWWFETLSRPSWRHYNDISLTRQFRSQVESIWLLKSHVMHYCDPIRVPWSLKLSTTRLFFVQQRVRADKTKENQSPDKLIVYEGNLLVTFTKIQ